MEGKKASIIMILEVLKKYSDEQHFLTQNEIIRKVHQLYGIDLERKSVANSIKVLTDLGYDIQKGEPSGFALFGRLFDTPEVYFLVDSILSSRSVNGNEASRLVNKIYSTQSRYQKRSYRMYKADALTRTKSQETFLNIEVINEAIAKEKWIAFKYMGYDENGKPALRYNGYEFHRSPCFLTSSQGRYYLVCYGRKYQKAESYRVDFMKDVKIMDDRDRVPLEEIHDFQNYSSIEDYINDHIYLFGGEVIEAEFEIRNPNFIINIQDWFGDKARIRKCDDRLIATIRNEEDALFYWALQYYDQVRILNPLSLRNRVKEAGKKISEE